MPHPHIPGMSLISNLLLPSAKQVSPGCTFLISDCLRSISWCTTYMYIVRCHTDPTEYRQLGPTIDKASCSMKTLHGYEKLTCFCFFMMVENSVQGILGFSSHCVRYKMRLVRVRRTLENVSLLSSPLKLHKTTQIVTHLHTHIHINTPPLTLPLHSL